jgi:hypothetical protein
MAYVVAVVVRVTSADTIAAAGEGPEGQIGESAVVNMSLHRLP